MPISSQRLRRWLCALALAGAGAADAAAPADLIFYNAKVWTVEAAQPRAQAVALRGNTIAAVGDDKAVLALRGDHTRVVDLHGQLLLPGFNDAHTHFENAVNWFFQVRVIDLDAARGQARLLQRLRSAVQRVPKGLWITGDDWGGAIAAAAAKAGIKDFHSFTPDLAAIDAITPDHPLLLRRYDGVCFANSAALKLAHVDKNSQAPGLGRYGRDPASGELNGMLYGKAAEYVNAIAPPMTVAQKLVGARYVETQLNRRGITSIADIARIDAITQRQLLETNRERSYSDMRIFKGLKARGELTVRVYSFQPLETWTELAGVGVKPGSGDALIRYGALKAFGDSGVMFAPMHLDLGLPSDWSYRFMGENAISRAITAADKAGYDVGVHIIGDKAAHLLIDWYAQAAQHNGPRDRRDRLIHAWYMTAADIRRAGQLHLIADVTSDHMLRNADRLDEALGVERAKSAFAWRSMIDAGVRVNLVSDLPGSYNKAHLSNFDPLLNMYTAVTRKRHDDSPGKAFHPEQAITVPEAIAAYTINPAYSSHEENIKGSITVGKLADLVVVSEDILEGPPERMLSAKVVYTVMDGKVVFERR